MEKKDNQKLVYASLKNLPITPRKVRLVTNFVKDKTITEALSLLENLNKRAAPHILKLLNSSIANAKNNFKMNVNELQIDQLFVNEGRKLKRFQPRAKGSAYPIWKRASHVKITLSLRNSEMLEKKTKPKKEIKINNSKMLEKKNIKVKNIKVKGAIKK